MPNVNQLKVLGKGYLSSIRIFRNLHFVGRLYNFLLLKKVVYLVTTCFK